MLRPTLPIAIGLLLLVPGAAAARTIAWSGYNWDVRPTGSGEPGPNQWSDSSANAYVDGSDLVLSIVKNGSGDWTSSEVDNEQSLGYGTYRWVVDSDLSKLDSNEVLGMFTYGGSSPSNNEIDIEPSHWGDLSWPTGSVTVWQNADTGRNLSASFDYSNRPPYVNQFTWEPGKITFLVTDTTGATLFHWVVTSGVPTPSSEVPMINYWRFDNQPPAAVRSMRIASFTWLPPGADPAPPSVGAGGGGGTAPGPPAGGGSPARSRCAIVTAGTSTGPVQLRRVHVSPARVAVGERATVSWTATGKGTLRILVKRSVRSRHGRRLLTLGSVSRSVGKGHGRLRLPGRIGGHRLAPGRYQLIVTAALVGSNRVPCAGKTLTLRVVSR